MGGEPRIQTSIQPPCIDLECPFSGHFIGRHAEQLVCHVVTESNGRYMRDTIDITRSHISFPHRDASLSGPLTVVMHILLDGLGIHIGFSMSLKYICMAVSLQYSIHK